MLAASGCHKDSFNFDEFTRPTTTTPDDGTGLPPSTRTPNVGITTDVTSASERGQIGLTVTSDEMAPAGGLAVMITIAGAMDGDFTANAPCTANLVCTVRILEGNRVGNLVLMPTSDAAVENSEEWTASLVDGGSNYNFAANNNVAFDITDPPTPGPMMPLPEVDIIATSDSVVEGNPVVLVITSDLAAPSTGLPVDINIGVAMDGEFTFTATGPVTCTNFPVCTVTIPSGRQMVELTLTPTSDFSTEGSESWTATLVDDDDNDYNLDAGNNNVGFDITDLIAAVGIATSNTGIEGGAAVTLTITSSVPVPATLTDGLTVTINIGDADDGEFTSANCIALVCEVVIDPTEMTAILIITPSPDSDTEGGSEDWTATIAPDTDNNIFTVDSSTDNAVFAVANMLPPVVDSTDLDDLNAYNTPTALSVNAMRAGVESASVGAIGGFQYNDADGNPRVLVERLDFANLGIWINGDITAADFNFAPLNINVVTPPTTSSALPTATYALEGEMTYNGNRFYPDGALMADFANAEVSGEISLDGQEAADDFGGTTLADGTTAITNSDNLTLGLNAAGISGGFSGALNIITAEGFFLSLSGTGTYSGRFNDNTNSYDAATDAPQEVSGIFGGITDANGNALNGGFLGQCSADCRLPIIGILTSDTAIEGGAVTLTITSDIPAPASGLAVTVSINGADNADFTSLACTTPPECVVVIASGMRTATLTIMASSDADAIAERWTAAIVIPANGDFAADPNNADTDFIISETDILPTAMNGRTLADLNAYTIPTPLAADVIRNLQSETIDGVTITASRYDDASSMPQVYVQMLEFAALGIWVNGNAPMPNVEFDHDYEYAFLGDNAVSTLPNSGTATYNIEGDATYRGVNFFPDGDLNMDFVAGTFEGRIQARDTQALNHFGSATAMVPDVNDLDSDGDTAELRLLAANDDWAINLDGMIDADGFSSTPTISISTGFFADLLTGTTGTFAGRFYDAAGYTTASGDPSEVAGAGIITDSDGTGNLHFGFLGRCTVACGP